MRSRWLTGNGARSLSRLIRHYDFSPAFTRNVLEHLGHNPDTYYIIGPDYRIPEPSEEGKEQCIEALQGAGFSDEAIGSALSTLGVPPGGHHPPKRSRKKAGLNQRSWPSVVRRPRGMCLQMTSQPARFTSSSELPTYTVAGQQPHDAARKAHRGSFPASRQETPLHSLRGSPWPQRKNSGTSSAFAIALMR